MELTSDVHGIIEIKISTMFPSYEIFKKLRKIIVCEPESISRKIKCNPLGREGRGIPYKQG